MKTIFILPIDFPSFNDWPMYKISYLLHMAYASKDLDTFTIVTDNVESVNDGRCFVCKDRFELKYDIEEEEWLYLESRPILNDIIAHDYCRQVYFSQSGQI